MNHWVSVRTLFLAGALFVAGCDYFIGADTLVSRAEQSMAAGDYQLAVDQSRKAVAKEPDNALARLVFAQASLKVGDPLTAEKQVERSIELGADPSRLDRVRIETLLGLNRPAAAEDALDGSVAIAGAERDLLRGRVKLASRNPAAALQAFEAALESEPGLLAAKVGRVQALVDLAQLGAAREEVDRLVEQYPQAGHGWLVRGRLDLRQGRFKDAAQSLAHASENARELSVPERLQSLAGTVEAHLLGGDVESAAQANEQLQKAAPGSPLALVTAARVALARGQAQTAVEILQTVVSGLPGEVGPRALLVTALLDAGSTQQALEQAGRLVSDFPDNEDARLTLAQAQFRTNRDDDARQTIRPLIDAPRPSARAVALAAAIEQRQGGSAAGLEFLERGVQMNPESPQLKIALASAYVAIGRVPAAIEALRSVPDGQFSVERDRMLVVVTAATRDRDAARSELDRALKDNPDDLSLLNIGASLFASWGDRATARSYLERALAVDPRSRQTNLALAQLDLADGAIEQAERRVQELLKLEPSDPTALAAMVEISARRGQTAEVERWLQEARQSDPKAIQPRLLLARSAFARDDPASAERLIAEVDAVATGNAGGQLLVGDVLATAGRSLEAMERFRRAAELDPALAPPYLGMARLHLDEGDRAAARSSLNRALELQPGWLPAAELLARLEASEGNLDAALRIVEDLKRRTPESVAPLVLEGDVMLNGKRAEAAVRAYDAAYAKQPSGALAVRASFARRSARLPNPERPIQRWLDTAPGDVGARRALAQLYLQSGQADAAATEYEKVVVAAPDDAESLNNLAWLYHERKDSRALDTAKRAYEMARQVPPIADTYAWILVQNGQVREGLNIFEQVSDKAEDNVEIQYHYAFALKADGQEDKARGVLQSALTKPASAEVRAQARQLLASLGG